MNCIVKQSKLSPVSFDSNFGGMRPPEISVMKLLIRKQLSKEILTKDDVFDLYMEHYAPSGYKSKMVYISGGNWERKTVSVSINDFGMRAKALIWFRNLLGHCIIKGKLLAIPVIDID